MKKAAFVLAMMALMVSSVFAATVTNTATVIEKPAATTNIPGTSAKVFFYSNPAVYDRSTGTYGLPTEWVSIYNSGKKLPLNTDYTLIYGVGTNAQVKADATCVTEFNTGKYGYFSTKTLFTYSGLKSDATAQRFWIVPSAGVDCGTGVITANNKNILFNGNTI